MTCTQYIESFPAASLFGCFTAKKPVNNADSNSVERILAVFPAQTDDSEIIFQELLNIHIDIHSL